MGKHNLEGKLTWEEMIYQPIFKTRIPTAYVYDEATGYQKKIINIKTFGDHFHLMF